MRNITASPGNAKSTRRSNGSSKSLLGCLEREHKFNKPAVETENLTEEDYELLLAQFRVLYDETRKEIEEDKPPKSNALSFVNYTWLEEYIKEISELSLSNCNGTPPKKPKSDDPVSVACNFVRKRLPDEPSDYVSLLINLDFFPPPIESRNNCNLKPVYIDGCAVVQMYNPDYCSYFTCSRTENLPYSKLHLLNVIPLVLIARHFVIRGHKVRIFLPKYYNNVYSCGYPTTSCKVDDPESFELLRALGLFEFIEPGSDAEPNVVKYLDEVMRDRVNEVRACFVSSGWCEKMYECARVSYRKNPSNNSESSDDSSDKLQRERTMLTPQFFGRMKRLVMPTGTHVFTGDDTTDLDERKKNYTSIGPDEMLFYRDVFLWENKATIPTQQLTLKEQLLNLSGLYSISVAEAFSIKLILAVGVHLPIRNMILHFNPIILASQPTEELAVEQMKSITVATDRISDEDDIDEDMPIDFGDDF